MRALGIRSFGKADKLEILDIPEPVVLAVNDILVRVKAAAFNPGDAVKTPGYTRLIETVKLPLVLGLEFSGTIAAVGADVTAFKPGDDIFGMSLNGGTAAESFVLSLGGICSVAKKPTSLSFVEASGLAIAVLTAITCLDRAEAEITGGVKGKTVFISAGLSGVGSIAVQLAKNVYGAGKVITTVSTKKVALVPELLGLAVVDQIVDYTTQDVVKAIGKGTVDFMIDTSFVAMSYIALMKPKTGFLITITGKSGQTLAKDFPTVPWLLLKMMDIGDAFFKWRASRWEVTYDHVYVRPNNADLDRFAMWAEEGRSRL